MLLGFHISHSLHAPFETDTLRNHPSTPAPVSRLKMATSQAIPSFEDRASARQPVRPSQDMQRVRWRPFGGLGNCVYVAENPSDPSSPQRPYQTGPASFHPISASALTEPPISSITVTLSDFEHWEETWVEEHVPHADDDQAVWVDVQQGTEGDEDDDGGDDGDGRRLMRCCDTSRPVVPAPVTVRSTSQPFVTIHDYVTAVHHWLQRVKGSVLEAKGVHESQPLPANTPFQDLFMPDLSCISLNQREPAPGLGPGAGMPSTSLSPGMVDFFRQVAAGQTPQPMPLTGFSEEYLRGLREDSEAIQRARQAGRGNGQ